MKEICLLIVPHTKEYLIVEMSVQTFYNLNLIKLLSGFQTMPSFFNSLWQLSVLQPDKFNLISEDFGCNQIKLIMIALF